MRSSRSSSRARADSVAPSGTSGTGAAIATSGSQSNSRRTFSIACSKRRRISASSISSRPTRSRSSASFCLGRGAFFAQPVELAARGARRFRLFLTSAPEPVGEALGFRTAVDEPGGQRVDRVALRFELTAARAGPRFFVGTGGEATFDFGEASREAGAPLFDRGAAHLELLAELGGLASGLLDLGAGRTELRNGNRFGGARFVECGNGGAQPGRRGVGGSRIPILRGNQLLEPAGQERVPFVE